MNIFSEMKKESSQSHGFIMWLDFSKVSKHSIDLLERPELLPCLPKIGSDNTDYSGKLKVLVDAARVTSSVAATILSSVKGKTLCCSKNDMRSIAELSNDFKTRMLSAQEHAWYEARNSWQKVINISMLSILNNTT